MKYFFILFAFPFLSVCDCGKDKKGTVAKETNEVLMDSLVIDSLPICIRKIIDDENKQSPSNTPIQVDQYLYKNKLVYLVIAHCCDQFNRLYDYNCNTICAPSGGFTGRGDGKCKDFDSVAKHVKLIWKDPSK